MEPAGGHADVRPRRSAKRSADERSDQHTTVLDRPKLTPYLMPYTGADA